MNLQDNMYKVSYDPSAIPRMSWDDLNQAAENLFAEDRVDQIDRLQTSYLVAGGAGIKDLIGGRGDMAMTTAEHAEYQRATGESMLPPQQSSTKEAENYVGKGGPNARLYKSQEELNNQSQIIAGKLFGGDVMKAKAYLKDDWMKRGYIIK